MKNYLSICLILFTIWVLLSDSLLAQKESDKSVHLESEKSILQKMPYRVGLSYSQLSAYGPSFGYAWSDKLLTKLIFFGIRQDDSDTDDSDFFSATLSLGFEIQYTLSNSESSRFYGVLGTGFYFSEDRKLISSFQDFSPIESYEKERRFNFGIGVGIEVNPFSSFIFYFETGLRYSPYQERPRGFTSNQFNFEGRHLGFGLGGGILIGF